MPVHARGPSVRQIPFHRLLIVIAVLLLVPAALIDEHVAAWVHTHKLGDVLRISRWAKIIKWPGDFRFTLAVGGIILLFHFKRWRGVIAMLMGGVFAGAFYTLVKWSVGRTRPFPQNIAPVPAFEFHPFRNGFKGLWSANNQAFPSGHACLAFSTAVALAVLYPRGRYLFFLIAMFVGIERVMEGAHYPSDAVGGAVFGILSAYLSIELIGRWLPDAERRGFPVVPVGHEDG
jgi:membrane-associated phospholipid phosphatase